MNDVQKVVEEMRAFSEYKSDDTFPRRLALWADTLEAAMRPPREHEDVSKYYEDDAAPPDDGVVRVPREPFVVRHYSSDERPTIKGNGFDGLEIGETREEAEEFIAFVNRAMIAADAKQAKDAADT